MDAMGLVVPFLVLASCIWVYFDARSIGGEHAHLPGVFGDITPALWAIGSLCLWIVVFPTYLFKRDELKRHAAEHGRLSDEYK